MFHSVLENTHENQKKFEKKRQIRIETQTRNSHFASPLALRGNWISGLTCSEKYKTFTKKMTETMKSIFLFVDNCRSTSAKPVDR